MEISGKTSEVAALAGVERTSSLFISIITAVLAVRIIGYDVKGILALGGIGSLAIGLAGRECAEALNPSVETLAGTRHRSCGEGVRRSPKP